MLPDYNCNKKNDDHSKNSYDDPQCGLIIRASAFDFCEEKQGILQLIECLLDIMANNIHEKITQFWLVEKRVQNV